jgi:hypothetical protein
LDRRSEQLRQIAWMCQRRVIPALSILRVRFEPAAAPW